MRKFLSFLMAIAMIVGIMTGFAPSEEVLANSTGDSSDARIIREQQYYILTVSTGISPGKDVLYFGVRYKDTLGRIHTHLIFPHEGDLARSFTLASNLSNNAVDQKKGKLMMDCYGIDMPGRRSDGLESNTTDDYLFAPDFALLEVIEIDIFLQNGKMDAMGRASAQAWTCSSISLYEIEKAADIKGVDMMGYFSNDYYIDFNGRLLVAGTPNSTLDANESGVVQRCRIYENSLDRWTLTSYQNLERDKRPEHLPTSTYCLKLDFATTAGSGLGGFVQSALSCDTINSKKSTSIMRYKDCLLLEVNYTDVGGIVRTIYIPMMMSEMCYLNMIGLGGKVVYGLGQSGDSLAFPISLPGYTGETKPGIRLFYSTALTTKACCRGDISNIYSTSKIEVTPTDIAVSGFQLYDEMAVLSVNSTTNKLEVATLGNPRWYYTSSTSTGLTIPYDDSGDSVLDISARLNEYTTGTNLVAKSKASTYYVEIGISDANGVASTLDDMTISFSYAGNKGDTVVSTPISVKTAVEEFYGMWVSDKNGGAYNLTNVDAGVLRFFVQCENVRRFNSCTIELGKKLNDDFQLCSIKVFGVDAASGKGTGTCAYTFDATPMVANGEKTCWSVTRNVSTTSAYVDYSKVHFFNPGNSLTIEFGATAGAVAKENDVDWGAYTYGMTYSDTRIDMGYDKIRNIYEVQVKVASDQGNTDNDSGSKNQFYFQILYANGKTTGYVLANQQLNSDGFRSGCIESFKIYSNYEYGDIAAIRIIPDDQIEGGDVYDKLKVETVSIVRSSNRGVDRRWTCEINDWIGIDYNDPGAESTVAGRTGRTEAEMARTYPVTESGYNIKLLAEVDTEGYFNTKNINAPESYRHMEGTMTYDLYYINSKGVSVSKGGDAAALMYEFLGREPVYKTDSSGKVEANAKIDTGSMMMPKRTSRFIISVTNPRSIQKLNLKVKGEQNATYWNISAVRLYKITGGSGGMYIQKDGSYVRDYDMELLTETDESWSYCQYIPANKEAQSLQIDFPATEDNYINIDEDLGEWKKINGAEPSSKDDVLNMYVNFASNRPGAKYKLGDYDLYTEILYTCDSDTQAGRVLTKEVKITGIDTANNRMYVTTPMSGLKNISTISFYAKKKDSDKLLSHDSGIFIDSVICEQTRSTGKPVMIDTYRCDVDCDITTLVGDANAFDVVKEDRNSLNDLQRVRISFATGTKVTSDLQRDESEGIYRDIGIALKYRSSNDTNKTYYTRTVFLSSTDYKRLLAHEVITLDFRQAYVDDIIGIRVIKQIDQDYEDMIVKIDSITTILYEHGSDEIVKSAKSGIETPAAPFEIVQNYMDIDTVDTEERTYATFSIKTSDEVGSAIADDNTRVRALISYENIDGSESRVEEITDLKKYIQSGSLTKDGDTVVFNVVMRNCKNIHILELEPVDDTEVIKTWKIDSITVDITENDGTVRSPKTVVVGKAISERLITDETAQGYQPPFRVNLCDLTFAANCRYMVNGNAQFENLVSQGSAGSDGSSNVFAIKIDNGTNLLLTPYSNGEGYSDDSAKFIKGSLYDVEVAAFSVSTENGTEILSPDPSKLLVTDAERIEANAEGTLAETKKSINAIAFDGTNESTQAFTYVIKISSIEVPDKFIKVYITIDGRPEKKKSEESSLIDGGTDDDNGGTLVDPGNNGGTESGKSDAEGTKNGGTSLSSDGENQTIGHGSLEPMDDVLGPSSESTDTNQE